MRMLVIGHPEAVLGFSLVGVHGQTAVSAEETNRALDDALAAPDIGIILVTEDVARLVGARINQLMLRSAVPLVIVIPPPGGMPPDQPSLREVVQRAIGVKL
jgi:V/A-type H+-transporting ATPase subunit F